MALDDLRYRARELIQAQFAGVPLWGWKDPRSCITLPFWQQLLPDMRYIVCLRNPVDVARSLEHRDHLSAEKSSHLWLTYVTSALKHSEGKPRLIVFYEDLMNDCLRELRRLADFLGVPERAEQVDVQEAVQEFVEKRLQHHRASIVQAAANPRIALRATALYIAQRISVSFGRKEINTQPELDPEVEDAVDILSQYSSKASGPPCALAEQDLARQSQAERAEESVRLLSSQLLDAETQLKKITDTLGWRLLSHYGRIKYGFLLPVYRLVRLPGTKPQHDHPGCVFAVDKGAGVDLGEGPPFREQADRKL